MDVSKRLDPDTLGDVDTAWQGGCGKAGVAWQPSTQTGHCSSLTSKWLNAVSSCPMPRGIYPWVHSLVLGPTNWIIKRRCGSQGRLELEYEAIASMPTT